MQYILTEEEYNELKTAQLKQTEEYNKALQELCTKAAQHIPVKRHWIVDHEFIWGCILDSRTEYCDHCPSQEVCPHPDKQWSK